jgi:outer membrane protein assembly factor BamB
MKGKPFTFPRPRGFGGMGSGFGGFGKTAERRRPPLQPETTESGGAEPQRDTQTWSRFRGSDASAVSLQTGLPTTWSDTENVVWKAALPGPGSSSPIVSGDRVYVTCYSGYGVDRTEPGEQKNLVRHVVCLSLADGKILWQASIKAVLPEDPYQGMITDHGYASSTPATDGDRVYAMFGKSGVVALDREGKQLWRTSVGTGSAIMGWGSAASVVLYKNLVIVNANAESQSLVALDKETGRQVWKTEANGYMGCWSTPLVVSAAGGKAELLVRMPDEIWALHPATGGLLWYCTDVPGAATSSPVACEGIVYSLGGGPRGSGSMAIRTGGRGDVTAGQVVWKQSAGSYVPSPVVVEGHLYWVDDRGLAYCLKADSGKQAYRERLPGAGGVYASLVAAGGRLYAVTRRNGTFVLDAKPEFKVVAHNRIPSDTTDFNASPATTDGRLLLRSNRFLYCIGAK